MVGPKLAALRAYQHSLPAPPPPASSFDASTAERRRALFGQACSTFHVGTTSTDNSHISTSYVERQNLTMRMGMRRFTRLTNGFSKKVDNHAYHVALHYMHYNFCRIHKSLRVTPAMEAGVTDHVWTIEEMLDIVL